MLKNYLFLLGIFVYHDIEGSRLKEEIDMDIMTKELKGGFKVLWRGEGKLTSSALTLKTIQNFMRKLDVNKKYVNVIQR